MIETSLLMKKWSEKKNFATQRTWSMPKLNNFLNTMKNWFYYSEDIFINFFQKQHVKQKVEGLKKKLTSL